MARAKEQSPAEFWQEYEKKCGEKVLSYTMGQYTGGWAEYSEALWGLVIATGGGFRFHHFPHESWLSALTRSATGGEAPREKTIFIPRERIISAEFLTQNSLLKRLFMPCPPRVIIRYRREDGEEVILTAETGKEGREVVEQLRVLMENPPDFLPF